MAYFGQQAGDNTATMAKVTREQLLDVITIITPTKTPLLSTLPKTIATNRTTEWLTDELASPGDPANGNADVQAVSEDTDASFSSEVGPFRIQNRTHIFRETVSASDLLDYVDTVDTDSVYASRLIKNIKLSHYINTKSRLFIVALFNMRNKRQVFLNIQYSLSGYLI